MCDCGHTLRLHFESVDDGSGCVVCQACDHFTPVAAEEVAA